MSAQPALAARHNPSRSVRPSVVKPSLSVVPSPVPARGYFRTVALCGVIFAGAIGGALCLNTAMIQGAYEIKTAQIELSEMKSNLDSLRAEVAFLDTPVVLHEKAQKYQMVPAEKIGYIDLGNASVSGEAAAK